MDSDSSVREAALRKKKEKGIETNVLVKVLKKGRLDSQADTAISEVLNFD